MGLVKIGQVPASGDHRWEGSLAEGFARGATSRKGNRVTGGNRVTRGSRKHIRGSELLWKYSQKK